MTAPAITSGQRATPVPDAVTTRQSGERHDRPSSLSGSLPVAYHLPAASPSASTIRRATMKKYVIERAIPGVDQLGGEELKGAAATSNAALCQLGPRVQWLE